MQFSVGAAINPKNKIQVIIDFMHGDADLYTDEKIAEFDVEPFEDKKCQGMSIAAESIRPHKHGNLADLIILLERIGSDFDRHDSNPFKLLLTFPGFEDWFSWNPKWGGSDHWPGDQTCDGEYIADLSGFKVFYYDGHGRKWELKWAS